MTGRWSSRLLVDAVGKGFPVWRNVSFSGLSNPNKGIASAPVKKISMSFNSIDPSPSCVFSVSYKYMKMNNLLANITLTFVQKVHKINISLLLYHPLLCSFFTVSHF